MKMKFLLLLLSVCCCSCLETTIEEATNETITIGQLNSDYVIKRTNKQKGRLTITIDNHTTITLGCDDVTTSLVVRNVGLVTSCTRDYYVIELKRPMARTLKGAMMTWQNDDVTNVTGKNWTLLFQGNKVDAVFDLDRSDQDMVSIPNGATYAYTRCVNNSDVIIVKEDRKSWNIYENSFTKCEEMKSDDLSCTLVVSRVCPGGILMLMQMKIKISDHGRMLQFVDGGANDVIRKFNITESSRNVRVELNGPTNIYKNAESSFTCKLSRGKASLRIVNNSHVILAETTKETSLTFIKNFDVHTILSCEATQENGQIVVAKSQSKEVRVYDPPHWKVKDEVCNLTTTGVGICKKTIIANPPAQRGYLYNGVQPIERVDICSGVGNEQSFKLSKMQQFDPNSNYTLKVRTLIGESDLDLHIVVRSNTTTSGPIEVPLVFLIILGVVICLQLAFIFICYSRKQKYKELVKEMADDETISFPRIFVSSASSSAASQVTKISRNASDVGSGGFQSQRSSICTFNTEDKRLSTDRSSKGNIKYIPPSDYILPATCNESEPEEIGLPHANAAERKVAISPTTASSLKPIDKRKPSGYFRRKTDEEKNMLEKKEELMTRVIEDKQPQRTTNPSENNKSES